jgi:hypothetical protein
MSLGGCFIILLGGRFIEFLQLVPTWFFFFLEHWMIKLTKNSGIKKCEMKSSGINIVELNMMVEMGL